MPQRRVREGQTGGKSFSAGPRAPMKAVSRRTIPLTVNPASAETIMDRFIARQAIFDGRQRVIAYELLFRRGADGFFRNADPGSLDATSAVLAEGSLLFGLGPLTSGKPAYVNFSQEALLDQLPLLLPPDRLMVELLETIEPKPEVLAACSALKAAGYRVALDDYVGEPEREPLLAFADIVKVDFRGTTPEQRREIVQRVKKHGVKLLAEKVETHEEFAAAAEMGYDYYQGFFFAHPQILRKREPVTSRLHCMRLLEASTHDELDLDEIEKLISQESTLCAKMLRYMNSAWFGLRGGVQSVRHMLFALGQREIRRWASLFFLTALSDDKPTELLTCACVRARFCELMAPVVAQEERAGHYFLMGLLSMMDAVADQPLAEVLSGLPLEKDMINALIKGGSSVPAQVFRLVQACERGSWPEITAACEELGVGELEAASLHRQAVEWANATLAWYDDEGPQPGGKSAVA